MKLTNLQRLGVSFLLYQLSLLSEMFKKGGTLIFEKDKTRKGYVLKVECNSGMIHLYQINENENIDTIYRYKFMWNSETCVFHIIDEDGKVEQA